MKLTRLTAHTTCTHRDNQTATDCTSYIGTFKLHLQTLRDTTVTEQMDVYLGTATNIPINPISESSGSVPPGQTMMSLATALSEPAAVRPIDKGIIPTSDVARPPSTLLDMDGVFW